MEQPRRASDEDARLEALRSYRILDTPPDAGLDHLTALASRICETRSGLITLVDDQRQWFKSRHGLDPSLVETPRDVSFCVHAILDARELMEVPDARDDARFVDNPLVVGPPHIRFYAGTPLVTPDGHAIGTLCVIDPQPRRLTPLQRDVLRALGDQVASHLELLRRTRELDRALHEEQRAAAELRDKSAMLEAILNTRVAAIVQLDPSGRIVYANPQAEHILGLEPSALLERTYDAPAWRHTAPDGGPWPDEAQPFHRVLTTGQPVFGIEHGIEWPDGRRRLLAINGAPVRDPRGAISSLVFSVTDISERRRLEEVQAKLESELRQSQKMEALGTLAGGIAHDFNNLVAAILGNADLALADLAPDHPARSAISDIVLAAQGARGLVRQILTFARKQPLERSALRLEEVVLESTKLLRASSPARVEVTVTVAEGVPAVRADRTQLQQLVLNLGLNAVQALRDRAGRVEIRVHAIDVVAGEVAGLAAGRYACLEVSDDGIGMDRATLDRIYDPFFTTKPTGEGTGLGLAVVHGIVRSHEGAITVSSAPGRGTTFRVLLPETTEASARPSVPPSPQTGLVGRRVMVVDDEEALVRLVTRALRREGFEVNGFVRPAEALAAIESDASAFDLVIVDLHMPAISGLDLARRARQLRPELPVVLMTGRYTDAVGDDARAAHVREVLRKPYSVQELADVVRRALTS